MADKTTSGAFDSDSESDADDYNHNDVLKTEGGGAAVEVMVVRVT